MALWVPPKAAAVDQYPAAAVVFAGALVDLHGGRDRISPKPPPKVGGTRDALRRIESVFRYAWRHDDAQHAALHHGIEALGAIVPHEALPERFRAQRYPQMEQIIATERARLSAARRGGRAS